MHGKEFVLDCIRTFFAVVTLVNVANLVFGVIMMPDASFGYEVFLAPLVFGFVGVLPNLVLYSRKELTMKQLLVRKVIQIILIEILVLLVALGFSEKNWSQPHLVLSVAGSVLIIYCAVSALDWLQNYLMAKNLTEDLVKFQNRMEE